MTQLEMDSIIDNAITHFGSVQQQVVAVEELSELQKEVCKSLRHERCDEHLVEEIADVQIMIEQLIRIYDLDRLEIAQQQFAKLARLQDRIIAQSQFFEGLLNGGATYDN